MTWDALFWGEALAAVCDTVCESTQKAPVGTSQPLLKFANLPTRVPSTLTRGGGGLPGMTNTELGATTFTECWLPSVGMPDLHECPLQPHGGGTAAVPAVGLSRSQNGK